MKTIFQVQGLATLMILKQATFCYTERKIKSLYYYQVMTQTFSADT
jgi:hypothetical protein